MITDTVARHTHTKTRQRDASSIANGYPADRLETLIQPLPDIQINYPAIRSPLTEVEDRRNFHPDRVAPVRSPRRWNVGVDLPKAKAPATPFVSPAQFRSVQKSQTKNSLATQERLQFRAPQFVAVCVRRKRRREVMIALGKKGRRKPRRTWLSDYRC